MAVPERAGPVREGVVNSAGDQRRTNRLVAGAEPFSDRHQIRRNSVLLAGMQRAGPPHAAHHLVED